VKTRCLAALLLGAVLLMSAALASHAQSLELKGEAAVLMDAQSGRILFEKNSQTPLPVASLTKIMTLTIVLEALDRGEVSLTDIITASEHAASKRGSRIWLETGEQMTLNELLYAIAVGSANDAAVAVAEYLAGSEQDFVTLMNKRAQELGLTNSYFLNSTGLPPESGPEHTMTAQDAAHLARHALTVPRLMDYVSTYEYKIRADTTGIPVLWNGNKLLRRYSGVDGIKTGFTTAAGYCMAVTAERDNLRLIAVVLGSPSDAAREEDVRTLLDYGFRRYHSYLVAARGSAFGSVQIWNGNPPEVQAVLDRDFRVTVERGREAELTLEAELTPSLKAPLQHGVPVGMLRARFDDMVVGSVPLVVEGGVERASYWSLLGRMIRSLAEAVF
jgi:D-alanyl-D-alanine carboxypeptidase (penicillin-binding protein 5/6)